MIRVGTAGWTLPTGWQDRFPEGETHLHSYGRVFRAVEINRTFRKTPRPSTFARWADSVPDGFRFSVKTPREVTHDRRLEDVREALSEFLEAASRLGDRLGPLLVQLPPSLAFDPGVAEPFLATLRELREGPDVLEARHESWFVDDADELLARHQVARVAADPPRAEADGRPGGWEDLAYFRLHGRPRTYYSAYRQGGDAWRREGDDDEREGEERPDLGDWLDRATAAGDEAEEAWVIFDNTARGEGTGDALAMAERLG